MRSVWSVAASPRWWQDCAREANLSLQDDEVLERLRKQFEISKHSWRIMCGLIAMRGAEIAVKKLYAELHNPFPEEEHG